MKKCSYCGVENPEDATQCITCHTDLREPTPPIPEAEPKPAMSNAEQRFWERMTLRQLAILIVRLQSLWLVFYALLYMVFLIPNFIDSTGAGSYPSSALKRSIALGLLRVVLYIAAAVAVVQYAERLVSWFVRDWVEKQGPEKPPDRG